MLCSVYGDELTTMIGIAEVIAEVLEIHILSC
jgi:hypothetical protein